jgi:uncharacterized membrane protein
MKERLGEVKIDRAVGEAVAIESGKVDVAVAAVAAVAAERNIDRAVGEGVAIESGKVDVAVAAVAVVIILRHWVFL